MCIRDRARALSEEFKLPVIDGVSAAVKHAEGLVAMGLTTSRINGYQYPVKKKYSGSFDRYQP